MIPERLWYSIWERQVSEMFFILGIDQKQQELSFDQTCICPACGRFGHLRIFVVYTCLSLFFLPVLKWGKRYYAAMGCCGATCELDPSLGHDLAAGRVTSLDPASLSFVCGSGRRHCRRCGFETTEDFDFCPKCGTRF